MVTATEQPIACSKCGKTIALWDGERIAIRRKGGIYIEVPGSRALIQCHHEERQGREWVICGYANRVNAHTT